MSRRGVSLARHSACGLRGSADVHKVGEAIVARLNGVKQVRGGVAQQSSDSRTPRTRDKFGLALCTQPHATSAQADDAGDRAQCKARDRGR